MTTEFKADTADPFYAPPRTPVVDIESNESNIRVEYDLRYQDYLLFICVHQFLLVPLQIFNSLCIVAGALIIGAGKPGHALFVGLVIFFFLWGLQYAFNALHLLTKKNRSLLTRHFVEIRDTGFYEETRYNRSLHFWNGGIVKVVSRPGFVAVYTAAHHAHVIPGRAFANDAHRSGFIATVRNRIGAPD